MLDVSRLLGDGLQSGLKVVLQLSVGIVVLVDLLFFVRCLPLLVLLKTDQ